ncbi:MAG: PPC domain-containing protein [Undibacterium sp.]|nr:PPC domain-containing protein [Undibacterium sp.]
MSKMMRILLIGLSSLGISFLSQISMAQTVLNKAQPVAVSLPAGSSALYVITIPSETRLVSVKLSGGSGNGDVYVQQNVAPTITNYFAKSTGPDNNENLPNLPIATKYFIVVYAVSAVQGANLVADYQASQISFIQSGQVQNNLSVTPADTKYFAINVPSGKTKLTFKLSGGTGDADLYAKFGALPSTLSYEKKSAGTGNVETITIDRPRVGLYYVLVNAYMPASGMSLVATVQ